LATDKKEQYFYVAGAFELKSTTPGRWVLSGSVWFLATAAVWRRLTSGAVISYAARSHSAQRVILTHNNTTAVSS